MVGRVAVPELRKQEVEDANLRHQHIADSFQFRQVSAAATGRSRGEGGASRAHIYVRAGQRLCLWHIIAAPQEPAYRSARSLVWCLDQGPAL